ncbi:ATP-binding cassette domain-containing protein, partial [Limnobacter sp. UBA1615]
GGQQQRVGIARAFMLDPEVVLADEPVASLDPKISADILGLIRDAARERGATVLCSLHQVDLAREFGDRIVGMRNGKVVFDGTPAEFTDAKVNDLYHGARWEDTPADDEEIELQVPGLRLATA